MAMDFLTCEHFGDLIIHILFYTIYLYLHSGLVKTMMGIYQIIYFQL